MIPKINKHELIFPHANEADEDGIVAWGGDLAPSRLIKAYKNGIFPWYGKNDPILWWSPNPRLIMELNDFKLSRSLSKSIKKFHYKFDINFSEVINKCASFPRKGQNATWIIPEVIEAYETLHAMGVAHSIASYKDDILVGGLYGIVVGKVFCGESMFADIPDASKAAYAVLIQHLKHWGYDFIDCQVPTKHLKSLGAKEVTREYFLSRLEKVHLDTIEHYWEVNKLLYTQDLTNSKGIIK